MSWWRRLFGTDAEPAPDAEAAPPAEPPAEPSSPAVPGPEAQRHREALARLERLGSPGGATVADALAMLRTSTGRPEQTAILDVLLRALGGQEPGSDRAGDELRVAVSSLLDARGQSERALALVRHCHGVSALMLAADLYAAQGQLGNALGAIERVLGRDIDAPGARERRERWRAQLGLSATPARPVDQGATVVAPAAARSSFRLLREVARGGAGTVYEAEDERLGRRLAYKVYHRAEADRDQVEREARAAVRLRGAGVVRIFDADPDAGWIAAEWVGGGSLRDHLGRRDPARLLPLGRWLPALVRAVGRVHEIGLVHSDIKPANVLFRAPDEPILADFGSCQPCGATGVGGTPGYLAPERIAGAPAHFRDDVYGLGRILEDTLAVTETHLERALGTRCRRLVTACLHEAAYRPEDAAALLRLMQAAGL